MRRSLGRDPEGSFAPQTLIAMHPHLMRDRVSPRFRYFLLEVKLPPTPASIATSGGNRDGLRVHLGSHDP